ncbi:MAG TPA: hypothetical protein VMW72_06305 [Sedimentisphaerales bacterium]|nr:hypothetical protein [Sedimentisphaerales bacterium]
MRNKINVWTITTIAALVLEGWALYVVGSSPAHWRSTMIVKDEPAARLYGMPKTKDMTKSLKYCSSTGRRNDDFAGRWHPQSRLSRRIPGRS